MLHGSKEQRVIQLGLDKLPTYGIMYDTDRTQIRDYIDCLIRAGYLSLTGDEYPVLRMTKQAKQVLFHGEKVLYTWRKQSRVEKTASSRKESKAMPTQADEGLLVNLKALRTKLAKEENVPAYIIFSNAALADMTAKQPQNMAEFLQVSGVGEVKAARYGQAFLEEILNWTKETGHG
jgi:ATP-dependent DNA helicase RecQ